jgi:hypothetical protein
VAEDAVVSEPVSTSNSLLTGKLTGNFSNLGLFLRFWLLKRRANSMACSKIPYAMKQGIILTEQGIIFAEQGILARTGNWSSHQFF